MKELTYQEVEYVSGAGGVRSSGSRSNVGKSSWSGEMCNSVGNLSAGLGAISTVSALIPGGQGVSFVSGGLSLLATGLYYQNC